MARMSVDDRFLRDPRVVRMAAAIGWSKYEARGRLLDVFAIVYDRVNADRSVEVSVDDVDTAADFVGLADRMVEFDLAVRVKGGGSGVRVRVRGSEEHTHYLSTREESGRAGGIKSGETRRKKAKQDTKVTFDESEGRSNPLPSPLPLPLPSALDLPLPSVTEERSASPPPVKPPKAVPGFKEVIDDFDTRYRIAYPVAAATGASWGRKQGGQVKQLLRTHGSAEVHRRIAILFDAPPSWLKPPYDFGTLVQHFDKLVVGAVRSQSALELQLERVAMLEAQERAAGESQ